MKVGFIGLGRMGAGMAANLVRAGHEVTVYNRTGSKVQALVAMSGLRVTKRHREFREPFAELEVPA